MSFHLSNNGKSIEKHENRRDAEHAFWILTAHELKNGRHASVVLSETKANGHQGPIVAATGITPPSELNLPSWAKNVLAAHDLL